MVYVEHRVYRLVGSACVSYVWIEWSMFLNGFGQVLVLGRFNVFDSFSWFVYWFRTGFVLASGRYNGLTGLYGIWPIAGYA